MSIKSNIVSIGGEEVEEGSFLRKAGHLSPLENKLGPRLGKSLLKHPAHWIQLCIHYILKDLSCILLQSCRNIYRFALLRFALPKDLLKD